MRKASKTTQHPDQLSLLAKLGKASDKMTVPAIVDPDKAVLDIDQQIRASLTRLIKKDGRSRAQIAVALSKVCGREITKAQLDSFTGAGRPNRLPADLMPAITVVLGADLLAEIAQAGGTCVFDRESMMLVRIGYFAAIRAAADSEFGEALRQGMQLPGLFGK